MQWHPGGTEKQQKREDDVLYSERFQLRLPRLFIVSRSGEILMSENHIPFVHPSQKPHPLNIPWPILLMDFSFGIRKLPTKQN